MLRLPDGMRDRLKAAAETNKRSMNAEIVERIEAYGTLLSEVQQQATEWLQMKRERDEAREIVERQLPTLPAGLAARIERAAISNRRTIAEEIVQALEVAFPPSLPASDLLERADWLEGVAEEEPDGEARNAMLATVAYWRQMASGSD